MAIGFNPLRKGTSFIKKEVSEWSQAISQHAKNSIEEKRQEREELKRLQSRKPIGFDIDAVCSVRISR